MSATVIVVVQPYEKRKSGGLYALTPIPVRDAAQGRQLARTMNCAGVVVFSRTGDPDSGEWADAEILLIIGHVPDDLESAA